MGNQNEIQAGDNLTRALQSAQSSSEVVSLLHQAATASGATVRTGEAVRAANGQFPQAGTPQRDPKTGQFVSAEQPRVFTKVVTVAGRDMEFTGDSAEEVETLINVARQTAEAFQSGNDSTEHTQRQRSDGASQAELEIRFRNGTLSAKDYLEQSGAIDSYLIERGVFVDKLKETIEQNEENHFVQSWESATTDFLNSSAGADWPGGERNRDLIALTIGQLGLTDASDKVSALSQAYETLKERNMLFAPEGQLSADAELADMRQKLANASQEEIISAMEAYKQNFRQHGLDESAINDQFVRNFSRTSSGLFGTK